MSDRAQVVRAQRHAHARAGAQQAARQPLEVAVAVGAALEHRHRPAVLARLHDLVIPVRALHQAHRQRRAAPRARDPRQDLLQLLGRVAQVGLQHQPRRGPGGELRLGQQLQHQPQHRLARVERLHVHVHVRVQLARATQDRAQPRQRILDPPLRRIRADRRRERRHLHRQVRPRQAPKGVGFQQRPLGPAARALRQHPQRVHAAGRIGIRLALAHALLAQQIQRAADAIPPHALDARQRMRDGRADDEAVRHALCRLARRQRRGLAAEGRARERRRNPPRAARRPRLRQQRCQVLAQLAPVAARRPHVDEAEQRRAQVLVARAHPHQGLIQPSSRRAPVRG